MPQGQHFGTEKLLDKRGTSRRIGFTHGNLGELCARWMMVEAHDMRGTLEDGLGVCETARDGTVDGDEEVGVLVK